VPSGVTVRQGQALREDAVACLKNGLRGMEVKPEGGRAFVDYAGDLVQSFSWNRD
jgi:hypothetical protein